MLNKQKGITLIALIITIIVMLILVGVTINVALNGGLFGKGEKAAFQTEASIVKEQLEMAKTLKVMKAEEKSVDDYSDITLSLTNLDAKTIEDYKDKIVVNKNGDICYNPANVTDQEKTWLEEIGIKAYVNNPEGGNDKPGGDEPTGTEYSFTLNELGEYEEGVDSLILFNIEKAREIIGTDLSQYLLNNWWIAIETDNELFDGFVQVFLAGEDIKETAQILVAPFIDGDTFGIGVYTPEPNTFISETPKEGQLTHKEFMDLYGDVEFRIIDPSSIELPT